MLKSLLIAVAASLLLVFAFAGCSDDCAECPETTVPIGYAAGSIIVTPATVVPQIEISGSGAVAPNLDSVMVGDSLVDESLWGLAMTGAPYVDAHWVVSFTESGDTSTFMYDHGDTALVRVWGEHRGSACRLKVLNVDSAAADIITPPATIDAGESRTFYWHKVDDADYYALMIPWQVLVNGANYWHFDYHYTLDTSFTVSGASQPDSLLSYDFVVTPFTGPDPRTGRSNWTGTFVNGVLYSFGRFDFVTTSIAVVIEPPPPRRPGEGLSPQAAARPEWNPNSIVGKVYGRYRPK